MSVPYPPGRDELWLLLLGTVETGLGPVKGDFLDHRSLLKHLVILCTCGQAGDGWPGGISGPKLFSKERGRVMLLEIAMPVLELLRL